MIFQVFSITRFTILRYICILWEKNWLYWYPTSRPRPRHSLPPPPHHHHQVGRANLLELEELNLVPRAFPPFFFLGKSPGNEVGKSWEICQKQSEEQSTQQQQQEQPNI